MPDSTTPEQPEQPTTYTPEEIKKRANDELLIKTNKPYGLVPKTHADGSYVRDESGELQFEHEKPIRLPNRDKPDGV